MKFEDLLTLVRAGYTREEIEAMNTNAPAADPAPAPAADPAPAPAADPVPAPAPAPAPAPDPVPAPAPVIPQQLQSMLDSLNAKIDAATAMMQKSALLSSMMHPPEDPSVEQVIAQIINPPTEGAK